MNCIPLIHQCQGHDNAKAIKSNPFKQCYAVVSDQLLLLLLPVSITHRVPIECHQMFINLKSSDVGAILLHAKNAQKTSHISNSTHSIHELNFPVLLIEFQYLYVLVIHRAATGKRKRVSQFQSLF